MSEVKGHTIGTDWPSFRYGPNDQARIFDSEADVPKGWVDHPSKVKNPLDHDGNGKAGGSLPRKAKPEPLDL